MDAFSRLIPQLSTTASAPDRELTAQIISAPSNTVLLARDRSNGARIVDLTSRRPRQAAHRLYEKVGFAVRDTSVYRYVPTHRNAKETS